MKFLWTTLHVKDLEESLKFYTEAIGLKLNRRFGSPTGMELAFLGDGETELELIYDANGTDVTIGSDISIGFEVASVDEKIKELAQLGISVHSGPIQPNPMIRFFYVMDPNGLKVQLAERFEAR